MVDNFHTKLTNDVVSFEQVGPGCAVDKKAIIKTLYSHFIQHGVYKKGN